MTDVVS